MAASIDSHFENIKLQYLRTYESDFHAVCIKMFKFPNTFKQNSVLLITPWHPTAPKFMYIYHQKSILEGQKQRHWWDTDQLCF